MKLNEKYWMKLYKLLFTKILIIFRSALCFDKIYLMISGSPFSTASWITAFWNISQNFISIEFSNYIKNIFLNDFINIFFMFWNTIKTFVFRMTFKYSYWITLKKSKLNCIKKKTIIKFHMTNWFWNWIKFFVMQSYKTLYL